MASGNRKKGNVMYTKPEEPSFLKKFKEKVGYKEDSGITEKFQVMPKATEEDLEDGMDELPQVVQLSPGDVSHEEYVAILEKSIPKPDTEEEDDGKIIFRKPNTKRAQDTELKASTKKKKLKEPESKTIQEEKLPKEKKVKPNRKLLSFDEDDEEDST